MFFFYLLTYESLTLHTQAPFLLQSKFNSIEDELALSSVGEKCKQNGRGGSFVEELKREKVLICTSLNRFNFPAWKEWDEK